MIALLPSVGTIALPELLSNFVPDDVNAGAVPLPASTTVPLECFAGGFRHNLNAALGLFTQSRPTTGNTNARKASPWHGGSTMRLEHMAAMGLGLFAALDGDKDASLTLVEVEASFENWFTSFDPAKSGALDNDSLYAGLRETLPQGFGGMGGPGGGFPGGRGGDAPAKPLTAEEVGLVRAWIDQGAK